jgi:hypothetical protein
MQLSELAIAEFQELYEKHFEEQLDDEEAEQEAIKMLRLVALTQPLEQPINRVNEVILPYEKETK